MVTITAETNWDASKVDMDARGGRHQLTIDEVPAAGGTDLGPGPIQYLLMGLGGCFMTLGKIVAGEMGLKIQHMRCKLEGDLDTDGMFAKNPAVRPGLQEIRLGIEVKSDEPDAKLKAWLEQVEARCPIKDSLSRPVPIKVVRK